MLYGRIRSRALDRGKSIVFSDRKYACGNKNARFFLLLIFLNTFAFLCSFFFLNVVIWRLRMKIKLEKK